MGKALEPPDIDRCQAMVPNGHNFMTLGGRPGLERCRALPVVIVFENTPGKDGLKGSMSLCDRCLDQARLQFGDSYFTVAKIERS